ncbi:pH-sensitive adenylate cyclase Rv1264 [Actinomyces bovis]|uniref:PH-sensitive adenylate cyclase Rv1264 n=1 Tax=Actinomyces bovis TaxID=1658 RepID=A0ABY1VMF3_9ACTO|nr:pH-sensitive adenylate cyclase Rv1264 [Actinomyces bovis]VEG52567.1 pH-sensitive adenylate cyclase Rv1264 [Actinomyces israelii]
MERKEPSEELGGIGAGPVTPDAAFSPAAAHVAPEPESTGGKHSAGAAEQAAPRGAHAAPAQNSTACSQEALLGGKPIYDLEAFAQQAGVELSSAERFWRAMGFADTNPGEVLFTDQDVQALKGVTQMINDRRVSSATLNELLRAQSYTMDRLVLWQLEAFVSEVSRRLQLDDSTARLLCLEHAEEAIEPLLQQVTYAWKRHLAALLCRTADEVARRSQEEVGRNLYPLTRSLGFVDIVSFTKRAQSMNVSDLTNMLNDFESTARDVVTSRGARVVKTIGDAVMYIADDLPTAADVVTALVDELQAGPDMLLVRASLVNGRVVSRSGDVFGPTVNLASRLVDTAAPGGIRMDEATALALVNGPAGARYRVRPCHEVVVRGLGQIVPWELERA